MNTLCWSSKKVNINGFLDFCLIQKINTGCQLGWQIIGWFNKFCKEGSFSNNKQVLSTVIFM